MGENPEIISKGYLSLSFAYIHNEKDILKLVTVLIANTKGEGKSGDDFWVIIIRTSSAFVNRLAQFDVANFL